MQANEMENEKLEKGETPADKTTRNAQMFPSISKNGNLSRRSSRIGNADNVLLDSSFRLQRRISMSSDVADRFRRPEGLSVDDLIAEESGVHQGHMQYLPLQNTLVPMSLPKYKPPYAISKDGITRAVVNFSGPPDPHPTTVCFSFPGTLLTHRQVLDEVRSRLGPVDQGKDRMYRTGVTIQFIDRNVLHGAQGLDNRWLVTLGSATAVDNLLLLGMQFYNRRLILRRYDDVLAEEYDDYLTYKEGRKILFPDISDKNALLARKPKTKNSDYIPFQRVLNRAKAVAGLQATKNSREIQNLQCQSAIGQKQGTLTLVSEEKTKDARKNPKK